MTIRFLGDKALALIALVMGIGGALATGTASANPVDPAFGPTQFHNSGPSPSVVMLPEQARGNPGQGLESMTGRYTFPDLTPVQKRMIGQAKGPATNDEGTAAGHGKPGGGGGGGGGGTATVPYWEANITSPLNGQTYKMSMVGTSPFAATPTASTITYVPILLKVTVGTHTYDPTQPACDDTTPVSQRFFNSPLFQTTSFNSNGYPFDDQLASAFQRASFYTYTSGTNYGVRLQPSTTQPIVVSVSLRGQTYNLTCSNGKKITLGAVSINTFDAAIQSVIAQYSTPDKLPIVLTYNIVESQNGQCCILGYHNAVAVTGGVQTYATGAYVDSGIFTGVDDITIWSHEITEWLDDPFVQAAVAGGGNDDVTPAWGHVGQVSGCQNNLEVGDPLSGTEAAIGGSGFNYHMQDLAFYDWFYRTQSHGTGGKYSFFGAFTGTQGTCS